MSTWSLHYHSISCICQACKHADVVVIGLSSPVLDWDIEPDDSTSASGAYMIKEWNASGKGSIVRSQLSAYASATP